MNIEYMREFLSLAQYQNFSIASQKLFISQPTLSRHITALEKELGTVLILRDTHRVKLTEDGEKTVATFQKIIKQYDGLIDDFALSNKGFGGSLKIGMMYYSINRDFGPLLPVFKETYPLVKTSCGSYQPHTMFQDLLNGKIDVGILAASKYGEGQGIVFHQILSPHANAIMSSQHPLAEKELITMSDLEQETIILLEEDTYSTHVICEAMDRAGFTPKQTIFSDHIDTVPFMIQQTGGIHINGSGFKISGYEDTLAYRPIENQEMSMPLALAYHKDNTNPALPKLLAIADQVFSAG